MPALDLIPGLFSVSAFVSGTSATFFSALFLTNGPTAVHVSQNLVIWQWMSLLNMTKVMGTRCFFVYHYTALHLRGIRKQVSFRVTPHKKWLSREKNGSMMENLGFLLPFPFVQVTEIIRSIKHAPGERGYFSPGSLSHSYKISWTGTMARYFFSREKVRVTC
jgi:hypothetical protein